MPKYRNCDIICGYTLYFTSKCIIEAMHVHASDSELTEGGSVKLFVRSDGSTVVRNKGTANAYAIGQIQTYIKNNYQRMYEQWKEYSSNGFYREETEIKKTVVARNTKVSGTKKKK